MRLVFFWVFVCGLVLYGQQGVGDIERLRAQVNSGVLPRKALEDAQRSIQRDHDEAILRTTLYGSLRLEDQTEEQAADMIGAARRLVAQAEQDLDNANRLVTEGVASRATLKTHEEELDQRRRTLELAEQRAGLFRELAAIVHAEEAIPVQHQEAPAASTLVAESFLGSGSFRPSQLETVRLSFEREFQRPLPVSARGETALHRSLGFDHRGRVDVALHPDEPAGRWLRQRLEDLRIPYFAFRADVRGKSTGAHIHIGPQSVRFQRAD